MKLSKKLLSLLLCVVMVLGSVAIGGKGFAEVFGSVLDAISIKASAENFYNVSFYVDGRLFYSTFISCGDIITTPTIPRKTGYVFGGWVDIYGNEMPETMPDDDLHLYASWLSLIYKVCFFDYFGFNTMRDYRYGECITPPTASVPQGGKFVGWEDSNGEIVSWPIVMTDRDLTFYAVYEPISGGSSSDQELLYYQNGLPVLSDQDARNFLSFLFDIQGGLDNVDLSNDPYYQLLTGSLPVSSAEELKAKIAAFLLIVQDVTNSHITTASNRNSWFCDSLIERLKKELGDKTAAGVAFSEAYNPVMGQLKSDLKEGILDFLTGKVSLLTGVYVSESVLTQCAAALSTASSISEIPGKVETFFNRACMAFDAAFLVFAQEKEGRYAYFSSYINNKQSLGDIPDAFECAMDYSYFACQQNSMLCGLIDYATVFTGKTSWLSHRATIDRWAEYVYQLGEFQKKSSHSYSKTVVAPTCTENGYTLVECDYCNDFYITNIKNAIGHRYSKNVVKPTCTTNGYDHYVCSRCGYSYNDNITSPKGHSAASKKTVSPTCVSAGYTVKYCSCGYSWISNNIPALGHSYTVTVINPGETTQGYTKHCCSACGYSYCDNYVDPVGHTYVATVVEPTCVDQGYTEHVCSQCGDKYTDCYTNATGHNYEATNISPSTCTEDGSITYTCTDCNNTYNEIIPKTEHDYEYQVSVIEPTCTAEGYTHHECICGASLDDGCTEALGHDYHMTEEEEACCINSGYRKYSCSLCGDEYTENIPAPCSEHSYEVVESQTADCLQDGYEKHECSVCHAYYYDNIEKTAGHNFVLTEDACLENKGTKTFTCSICGFSYTLNHEHDENTETEIINCKEVECEADGYTGDTACSMCGCVFEKGSVIPAKGHSFVWIYNFDATIYADGTETEICSECDAKGETRIKEGSKLPIPHIINTKPSISFEDSSREIKEGEVIYLNPIIQNPNYYDVIWNCSSSKIMIEEQYNSCVVTGISPGREKITVKLVAPDGEVACQDSITINVKPSLHYKGNYSDTNNEKAKGFFGYLLKIFAYIFKECMPLLCLFD